MQDHEAKGNENSENPQNFEATSGKRDVNEKKVNDQSVIVGVDKSRNDENLIAEKVCKICHLGKEKTISGSLEVISLGCDCKGELGFSHRHCAETWFCQRKNRDNS
ncbi:RING-CH-type domain-containing protein [Abeliophyllum distichum]|uniref:RING-CH-type domain-containing protein n=1 Tax=Abeliophyllum distichum TaxID=126358 RepID=A0ABD1PB35_9LAMI